MKTKAIEEVFKKHFSEREIAQAMAWAHKEARRMALRDLRQSLGITQKQLADSLKVSQPVVSAMENRQDFQLTTLRRVIQALGGNLAVIAHFGDRVVALRVA